MVPGNKYATEGRHQGLGVAYVCFCEGNLGLPTCQLVLLRQVGFIKMLACSDKGHLGGAQFHDKPASDFGWNGSTFG